jgi:hypothetical protein
MRVISTSIRRASLSARAADIELVNSATLCANDNETKYPVKFRLRAT